LLDRTTVTRRHESSINGATSTEEQRMRIDLGLRLRDLTCVQPEQTDDESFASGFHCTLDGSTVVKRRVDTDRAATPVRSAADADMVEPGRMVTGSLDEDATSDHVVEFAPPRAR
jgi:hypothetical protein